MKVELLSYYNSEREVIEVFYDEEKEITVLWNIEKSKITTITELKNMTLDMFIEILKNYDEIDYFNDEYFNLEDDKEGFKEMIFYLDELYPKALNMLLNDIINNSSNEKLINLIENLEIMQ